MDRVLSISVAAYNIEHWIRDCLDSFTPEGIRERVEVIVTDDGSTDRTPEIAEEYVGRYPETFRLIRQKNAGPGSTVNSGIRNASCRYFRMVDGDDWVDEAGMKAFLDFLEQTDADMVCSAYCTVREKTGERKIWPVGTVFPGPVSELEQVIGSMDPGMHNVTYRTALLTENRIRLDNGFYTDMEYLLFPFPFAQTAAVFDRTVYMYRIGDESQSMSIRSLQKRENEHYAVLRHLVRRYGEYEKSPGKTENKSAFLARRIAGMAGTQLSIWLSLEDTSAGCSKTRSMMEEIRKENASVYREMLKLKSFRLLAASRFLLYPPLARFHKRKLGL